MWGYPPPPTGVIGVHLSCHFDSWYGHSDGCLSPCCGYIRVFLIMCVTVRKFIVSLTSFGHSSTIKGRFIHFGVENFHFTDVSVSYLRKWRRVNHEMLNSSRKLYIKMTKSTSDIDKSPKPVGDSLNIHATVDKIRDIYYPALTRLKKDLFFIQKKILLYFLFYVFNRLYLFIYLFTLFIY